MLAAAAVLLLLGLWTYSAVERSLRDLRASSLTSMLESEARSVVIWIENHKTDIRRIARDPQVRGHIEALAKIAGRAGASPEEYCNTATRRPLVEQLTAALEEEGAVTFNAIDRSQRIIASRFREYCGLRMTAKAFEKDLEPVFRGETRFVPPYAEAERLEAVPAAQPLERPVTWIETPVRNEAGAIVAALGFGEYADGQLAAILSAGRTGETGEAYAFDRSGRLLSKGRFADGDGPALTPLAAHAAKSEHGTLLDAYPSYHGAKVLGTWRWLPEYDMGIAIEIAAEEAYAPLRYLNIAFGVVFGALVIAVVAALASAFSMLRLRKQMGERRLGAYALKKQIGEGGVATVYLAQHDLLKRPTAIKLLKPARATDEMIARFEREVQLASSLAHPNTVEIFDYGRTRDGLFYYAMEYLDGLTISQVIGKSSPALIGVARSIYLLRQICAGLSEAHGKGLVHRDVKPENIMVCRYGGEYDFVKILDFGLVKHVSQEHSRDLTRSQRILGTPLYMAPERLRDPSDVDGRSDIYAVGAVAFLMLSGRRVFESADDLTLSTKILNDEPPRLAEVAPQPIPMEVDLIVNACLEKKRENRPQRVGDLIEAFDALTVDFRWTQRDAQAWWSAIP